MTDDVPHGHRIEPFWDAQLALAAVIGLFASLPAELRAGPWWLLPGVAAIGLLGLVVDTPRRADGPPEDKPRRHRLVLGLMVLLGAASVVAVANLVHLLLTPGSLDGTALLGAAARVWFANLAIFAVGYWMLDRGGPVVRSGHPDLGSTFPDLLFPQMSDDRFAPPDWMPSFWDYLYVSLTAQTAFSPTDTMPLTPKAKAVMGVQSLVSFVTIALVAARAVNILP